MKQTRRNFLQWLFGLFPLFTGLFAQFRARGATTAAIPIAVESNRAELTFLIFGDWGRGGEFHQRDVANQMGLAAEKRHCRFIVSVGDNFYEKGVESAVDPQWKSSFEAVYTAPSLGAPWYVILGNHDYKGRPQAQLDYAEAHPNWKMPARYFSTVEPIGDKEKVEFFFIDTSPFVEEYRDKADMRDEIVSQDTSAQVRWLDQALSNSTASWKIVIGHHPIFSGGSEHGDQPELIRDINPLLEKHRVPAYFNGHDHDLQHIVRGSVEYFNTGAGSKVRKPGPTEGSRFYRGTPGFMAVALTAKEM
ncbi:MAG: metallophosphoesterase, partial [Verrucomicrobia bacterium]|nr:metallophosphoesterase [Verrucomicrobiota bacterium]